MGAHHLNARSYYLLDIVGDDEASAGEFPHKFIENFNEVINSTFDVT